MHSKKLLSLALSLFVAESVVAGPCKPRTSSATSVASTTLAGSTTAILPVSSTTDTSVAVIETSTTAETTETDTETATTLLTSTTAASVDTTTTGEGTTTAVETTTAADKTSTTETESTNAAESGTTVTTEAVTTTGATTTTAEVETTTTEAATTTTVADPGCAQTILLANPTPIFDAQNGRYDDFNNPVTAPFPIEFFGAASTNVYVSTNGFLSLDSGSNSYANTDLPNENIPSNSIMPYWDDLLIAEGTCNTGIFYDVYETARGNTFTIEYNVGSLQPFLIGTGEHFSVSFYEDHPGLVRFEYYQTTKHGSSATIGLQSGEMFSQFSRDEVDSVSDQYFIEIQTTEGGGALTLTGSL